MTKPLILITGVMRSGTSFLTRALNLCGVYLGEYNELHSTDISPVDYNLGGTWESLKVLELIKKTTSRNSDATVASSYQVDEDLGQEIYHYTRTLLSHPSLACGFKIQMLCIDGWMPYLHKCTDNIIIAATFRNPVASAQSIIGTHNKIKSYEEAIAFWKRLNNQLLEVLSRYNAFLFDFDWHRERLFHEINQSARKIGLIEGDIKKWHSQDLKHSTTYDHEHELDGEAQDIYTRLQERSNLNSQINIHPHKFSEEELKGIIKSLLDLNAFQAESFNRYIRTNRPDLIYENVIRLAYKAMKGKIFSKKG